MKAASSVAIACVLACAASAFAQSSQAAATIQFDQGRTLMRQHKYKEACAAFDRSQKLDAQNGTLFNLADCNTRIGKLATAWLAYRDLGQRDTNAGRKQESNRRAKELDKRLPKLLVQISSPPSGLALTINDTDATSLVGFESPVDLGDYKIRATAPGFARFETTTSVTAEGKTVKVNVVLEKASATVATTSEDTHAEPTKQPSNEPSKQPVDEPVAATSHRKRNGTIIAITGGGLVVVGLVFGMRARSSWDDAETLCPNQVCTTAAGRQRGDDLVDSARTNATVATGFVFGGAVVAAVGIYLAATATPTSPAAALRVAPTSGGAIVGLGGRF